MAAEQDNISQPQSAINDVESLPSPDRVVKQRQEGTSAADIARRSQQSADRIDDEDDPRRRQPAKGSEDASDSDMRETDERVPTATEGAAALRAAIAHVKTLPGTHSYSSGYYYNKVASTLVGQGYTRKQAEAQARDTMDRAAGRTPWSESSLNAANQERTEPASLGTPAEGWHREPSRNGPCGRPGHRECTAGA